jgi:hypothetical protein
MANPSHLFRVINEFVFMLVGALLMLFALTGRYLFNPRRPGWIALSALLIVWGLGTWRRAHRFADKSDRLVTKIAGGSLSTAGLVMLSLAWAPFEYAGWLLLATGSIFVLRGLVSAAIMARSA